MAGQEEYTALRKQDIRDREGSIIVYSVASRSSFARVANSCNQICSIRESGVSNFDFYISGQKYLSPLILVGNHCERPTQHEVSIQEGSTLTRELECDFVEVSAKNYVNVENMFYTSVRQVHSKRLEELGELGNLQQGPAAHGSCFKEASKISRFLRRARLRRFLERRHLSEKIAKPFSQIYHHQI